MEEADSFRKLKMEYPELEEGVVHEALINNDYDLKRASDALRAKYYKEDAAIEQETSIWSSLFGPLIGSGEEGTGQSGGQSDWDLSLDGIQEGVANLGMHLVTGVDAIADTLGSLGDLIPDLIFGSEDAEYDDEDHRLSRPKEKDQVVVAGSRTTQVKKRGTPGPKAKPAPQVAVPADEYSDEDEEDDWTKED